LIDIADQDEAGLEGQGAEEMAHEREVDHGTFIDNEQVAIQGIVFPAEEPAGAGLDFEEAMDGAGREAGGFGESFGGAAGGGAEQATDFFGAEDEEEAIDERGFAYAGAAGDDEEAGVKGLAEGLLLGGGE